MLWSCEKMKIGRRSKGTEGYSFLDHSVRVEGELRFTGTLRIEGVITGSVTTSDGLVVGSDARVEANIHAGHVTVFGTVIGNVTCDTRVEICDGGVLVGEVRSAQLLIEEGGRFEGTNHQAVESGNPGFAADTSLEEKKEDEIERQSLEVPAR
jgi:cytoskeletal protein CcmA (bactofilin family)